MNSSHDGLSFDDHLQIGFAALREIADLGEIPPEAGRICFHFSCPDSPDSDRWGDEAEYIRRARQLFEELPIAFDVDYVGGTVGIEAWETTLPNESWLSDRLPRMIEIAKLLDVPFLGWSFEPTGFPYVNACPSVNVVNANTPDGQAVIEQLMREAEEARRDSGQ